MVTGKCTNVFRGIFLVWGDGYRGGSFHAGTYHGGRDFQWRAAGFFSIILKNNEKINMKSFFY